MIKSLILMLQFFTRLPINLEIKMEKDIISKGIYYFPVIGMLIGLISYFVYFLLSYVNLDVASFFAVLALVLVTGGLHIDGLSDTFDGFFSGRSKERVLEIMKDSRVGTFGVVGIIFDVLLKYIIIKNISKDFVLTSLVFSCGIARLGASFLIAFGKSARPGGLGDLFASSSKKKYFYISAILFSVLGIVLVGIPFMVALSISTLFVLYFMKHSYKVIGGLTGDVYGATIELVEIISLFIFMVVSTWI